MALTENETFGTIVPGFVTDLSGNLVVADAGSSEGVVPGFLTDEDGRLVVTTDATGATIQGGFLRSPDGALVVSTDAGTYGVIPGFSAVEGGALSVENEGTPVWNGGFLRNAAGSICVTGLSLGYQSAALALGPAFYIELGATDGLVDLGSGGNDATATGSPTIGGDALDPFGDGDGSTNFNGTTQWIDTAYNPFVTGSRRTYVAWVWRDQQVDNDPIFTSAANTNIFYVRGEGIQDEISMNGNNASAAVTSSTNHWAAGQWVHTAVVFDFVDNHLTAYANGVQAYNNASYTNDYGAGAQASTLRLGHYSNTNTGPNGFDGKLRAVAVYEKELTPAQIADLAGYAA